MSVTRHARPMALRPPRRPRWHRGVHGLSIVELMVGIAIGLFIVAGASLMLTTQLGDNRRLLLEAQIQQDLRAAAGMISRDVRRAGYWGQAYQQIWPVPTAIANPYTRIEPASAPAGTTSIEYDRSTDEEGRVFGSDDNAVDGEAGRPRERVGFRLNTATQTIEYMVGADNWQALTDSDVLAVTQFNLVLNARDFPVPCGTQCPVLGPGGCPLVQTYRDLTITIVGQSRTDAAVQRSLQDNVRLRNSVPREACP